MPRLAKSNNHGSRNEIGKINSFLIVLVKNVQITTLPRENKIRPINEVVNKIHRKIGLVEFNSNQVDSLMEYLKSIFSNTIYALNSKFKSFINVFFSATKYMAKIPQNDFSFLLLFNEPRDIWAIALVLAMRMSLDVKIDDDVLFKNTEIDSTNFEERENAFLIILDYDLILPSATALLSAFKHLIG